MEKKKVQWHPAFQAALQIEFYEEQKYLQFFAEHNLTKLPLRMDTLIIKLEPKRKLKRGIGQIFREHNIVEYKSPSDYFSVNDFYKLVAYTCLYQSDTEHVLEISPEEITMSTVSLYYPREMLHHLKKRYEAVVEKRFPGIYYVRGLMFPMQVVVEAQLPKGEYIWLSRLKPRLKMNEDIEPLARAYKNKEKSPNYSAVMDAIMRANPKEYKEAKEGMCDALRELFADELLEGREEGRAEGKEEGREEGRAEGMSGEIRIIRRKKEKGMDSAEISELMEMDEERTNQIISLLLAYPSEDDTQIAKRYLAAEAG